MSDRPACYSVTEAAKRLNRDPKTVKAWMARGRLAVVAADDPRNPLGEPLLLAEDVDAAAERSVVLLRPEPSTGDALPSSADQDWYRRENQQLSTRVEVLEERLAATRAELAAERRRHRRLLEGLVADLAADDEVVDAR